MADPNTPEVTSQTLSVSGWNHWWNLGRSKRAFFLTREKIGSIPHIRGVDNNTEGIDAVRAKRV